MKGLARYFTGSRKWIYIGAVGVVAAGCLLMYSRPGKNQAAAPDHVSSLEPESNPSATVGMASSPALGKQDAEPSGESFASGMPGAAFPGSGLHREKAYAEVQSSARPFGLDVVEPVQLGGTDPDSKDFADNLLPDILDFIENNRANGNEAVLSAPDTEIANLTLVDPTDVRVYFVADSGEYHNSVGMLFGNGSGGQNDPALIFPDASSNYGAGQDWNAADVATSEDYPLVPGDFIEVGWVDSGNYLDLFIIPRGADEESEEAYYVDKTLNEDQTSHMKPLGVAGDSMLVIGFEDMKNGGDQDYDDVVIAVDVGKENLDAIAAQLGLKK